MKINKQHLPIVTVFFFLVIVGIVFYLMKRDPYVCFLWQKNKTLTVLEPLIDNWDDVTKVASHTPRMGLNTAILQLQEVQRQINFAKFPGCSTPIQKEFLNLTEETIDQYMIFMSGEEYNDSKVALRQEYFLFTVQRLNKRETLDPDNMSLDYLKKLGNEL